MTQTDDILSNDPIVSKEINKLFQGLKIPNSITEKNEVIKL